MIQHTLQQGLACDLKNPLIFLNEKAMNNFGLFCW